VILGRARHSRRTASPGDGEAEWGSIDAAGILGDPEVISALQVQASASRNRIRNLQRLEEPTAGLIRLLEAELGGRR
jgi:hypothetical protein